MVQLSGSAKFLVQKAVAFLNSSNKRYGELTESGRRLSGGYVAKMVDLIGIEPTTFALRTRRSPS